MKLEAVGVDIKNLCKIFKSYHDKNGFYAVDHVSLQVEPGSLVTILGPSGCGKTTMLRMVAGFEIPSSGEILLKGREISTLPPNKRNVGMMFQSYALFPHLSVYDNIAYGLTLKRLPKPVIDQKVKDVLEIMQISTIIQRMPNQLSGGQQQRVALARAVVTEPSVLLFDEPLSNLDAKLREYMRDELRKIQQSLGITSIYVTHDQNEAMAISDKIVIMQAGTIEQMGTPWEIYTKPANRFVADFMGRANFVRSRITRIHPSETRVSTLGGEFTYTGDVSMISGENCVCMVRPDFFTFADNGKIEGRIVSRAYLGTSVEYVVAVGNEVVHMVDYGLREHGIHAVGSIQHLAFDEKDICLFPSEAVDVEKEVHHV
ncbi:MAG: ABC transporter ATP-binding protein [Sphaerochaetaceae bacterium]